VYQTRKRGTLETDLLLSTFARDELPKMGLEEMREFDKVGGSVISARINGERDQGHWHVCREVAGKAVAASS
jgi:hypothetical protein